MWAAIGVVGGFVLGLWAASACLLEAGAIRDWGRWRDGRVVDTVVFDPWQPGKWGVALGMRFFYEGDEIPPGWGLAYRMWDGYGVFMPIPFNVVTRWIRSLYMRARFGEWDATKNTIDGLMGHCISMAIRAERAGAKGALERALAAERHALDLLTLAERESTTLREREKARA